MSVILPFVFLLSAVQDLPPTPNEQEPGVSQQCDDQGNCIIEYSAAFFDRYNPINARDMVVNIPGFQIDDGNGSRGFAGAAGNILINGERPATKTDSASQILSRISASAVERIDLIRGQTGGLDLRGQSVAINVILKADGAGTITWSAGTQVQLNTPGVFPFGEISYSDNSGTFTYTVGVSGSRFRRRFDGLETLLDPNDIPLEFREEVFSEDGFDGRFNLNAQLKREHTTYRINGSISGFDESGGETSIRFPPSGAPISFVLQGEDDSGLNGEVGAEIERGFGTDFTAKWIGLYRFNDNRNGGSLGNGPALDDVFVGSVTSSRGLTTEIIARAELDYSGLDGHLLELAAEGAINRLESDFSLGVDNEDGQGLILQEVPGAQTEVRELRGDFSLSDSFKVRDIAVDGVLAAEISNIEQTGGFEENRTFFFFKPSLTATWSPQKSTQIRARALREIGQLNFSDFVSSTDLGDGELALGNPDLAPSTTWVFDLTAEKRFGNIGAVTVTGFYNIVSDVLDVLPIGNGLEVPGNIGDGFRRGVRVETTVPLDRFGLKNSRLDVRGRYQGSQVTDPVTGELRRFSRERLWRASFEFRQDLTQRKWAWGWRTNLRGDSVNFGLDELDIFVRPIDMNVFIETTRVKNIKIRLGLNNIFDEGFDRNRTVFEEARGSSPVRFREVRGRDSGRRLRLTFSGTF